MSSPPRAEAKEGLAPGEVNVSTLSLNFRDGQSYKIAATMRGHDQLKRNTSRRLPTGGIREARRKAGLRQSDLAKTCGLPLSTIKLVERGLVDLDGDMAQRIATALGVSRRHTHELHSAFKSKAIPGEGYTTSKAGNLDVTPPRQRIAARDKRLRILDLFCGAGGLSYGFEKTGHFVTTGGIDLLQDRIATFTANHAFATGIAGDICRIRPDELFELIGPIDVIVGGPPCQGFSSIRPFRNLIDNDPRNNLVENYVLMLSHLKPRWFVFENVVGLVSHDKGRKLRAILEAFGAMGYSTTWRIVNAANFGVPQSRERVVIIGNRIGLEFSWPTPTHTVTCRSMAGKHSHLLRPPSDGAHLLPTAPTVMDAISDLPVVVAGAEATRYVKNSRTTSFQEAIRNGAHELTWHRATGHSSKMLEIIRHAGKSINDLPKGMVRSGFSSCYSRLDADRPSNTITVNFVHPASNRCIHPYQDRALTPREGARLQSFPDSFEFKGTIAQVVKQIGNAVPPKLGEIIANAIYEQENLFDAQEGTSARQGRPRLVKSYRES